MALLSQLPGAADYLLTDMIDDVLERLAFLRHTRATALVIGDVSGRLRLELAAMECAVEERDPADGFDEEMPFPSGGFDLVVSLGTLDTVNDLPGALIHLRNALAPGGLMIASFVGAGSLPVLRSVMLEADGDRPAARMHPLVDVRAGGQLLQRTGWKSPVVDSHTLTVRFGSFDSLVADLRAQGLSNVLANGAASVGKAGLARAREAFLARADADGRVSEQFELLTLSGWRPALPG